MRTSYVINAITVFAAILFLYIGYGYYIDRAMEKACEDSEAFLSKASQETLSELVSNFDTPPETLTQNYLTPKITEIRKIQRISDPITLSELEAIYFILGEHLEPEPSQACDLFTNIVHAAQAKTILLYTEEYKKADRSALASELKELPTKSRLIDHINPELSCGLDVQNPILESREEDYCRAIHEQNYRLVKELEAQMQDNGRPSQIYKATIANCFAECLNNEISCVEDCWQNKLS